MFDPALEWSSHGNYAQDWFRAQDAHISKASVKKKRAAQALSEPYQHTKNTSVPDKHHLLLLHKLICDEFPCFPKERMPHPNNEKNNPWTEVKTFKMRAEAFPQMEETSPAYEAISAKPEK